VAALSAAPNAAIPWVVIDGESVGFGVSPPAAAAAGTDGGTAPAPLFSVRRLVSCLLFWRARGHRCIAFLPSGLVSAHLSEAPLLRTLTGRGVIVLTPPQDKCVTYAAGYAADRDGYVVTNSVEAAGCGRAPVAVVHAAAVVRMLLLLRRRRRCALLLLPATHIGCGDGGMRLH
jgi:hypothetical protein